MELKQLKLANNEEVMCEIVEWNNDETDEVIIRKALKIVAIEDIEEGMRYYTFKPWMSFEQDPDAMHTVNAYHIVGTTNPGESAISYFNDIIDEMREYSTSETDTIIKFDRDSDSSNVIQFDPSKSIH
jgi:hypothetical protein